MTKESTELFKQGKIEEAIALLDKEIKEKDKLEAFPLYKKKCQFLYKTGRGDESWIILGDLLNYYMGHGYDGMWSKVYDEQRKQCEYEKDYVQAFKYAIWTRIYDDRMKIINNYNRREFIENPTYPETARPIDYNWEDNKQFVKLAGKVKNSLGLDWQPIKFVLVKAYQQLDYSLVNSNFLTQIILNVDGELLKQGYVK